MTLNRNSISSKTSIVVRTAPILLIVAIVAACGGKFGFRQNQDHTSNDDSETNGTVVSKESATPEDSTGNDAVVKLSFGSVVDSSAGLALIEEPVATPTATPTAAASATATPAVAELKINDHLFLTVARISIAAVRVAPKSQLSPEEEQAQATEDRHERERQSYEDQTIAAGGADSMGIRERRTPVAGSARPDHTPAARPGDQPAADHESIPSHVREILADKAAADSRGDLRRDQTMRFSGPFVFDAIAGKFEGKEPSVDLKTGTYRRVEFKLKRNWDAPLTDPLLGRTIYVEGYTVDADGTKTQFKLWSHIAQNIRLRSKNDFVVTEGAPNVLKVVFNLSAWFKDFSLGDAKVKAGETVVIIRRNQNQDILHALLRQIREAVRFGKDENQDGKLGAKEDAQATVEATTVVGAVGASGS